MADDDLAIPADLRRTMQEKGSAEQRAWLVRLPQQARGYAERWGLRLGAPFEPGGHASWVAPGVDRRGDAVVLKIGWTHDEARDEAAGLALLDGRGAVRLLAHEAEGDVTVSLLERCVPGEELRSRPEREQHGVVVGIAQQVWATAVPASAPFRPLAQMCEAWVAESAAAYAGLERSPLDAGLVREGLATFVELARTAPSEVLLCTDLHAGNVLSSEREPWLLIDPKPYVGDPHYDLLQHVLNCDEERQQPRELVRRLADLAGLDAARLEQWLLARCVVESAWWPELAPVARELAPR